MLILIRLVFFGVSLFGSSKFFLFFGKVSPCLCCVACLLSKSSIDLTNARWWWAEAQTYCPEWYPELIYLVIYIDVSACFYVFFFSAIRNFDLKKKGNMYNEILGVHMWKLSICNNYSILFVVMSNRKGLTNNSLLYSNKHHMLTFFFLSSKNFSNKTKCILEHKEWEYKPHP